MCGRKLAPLPEVGYIQATSASTAGVWKTLKLRVVQAFMVATSAYQSSKSQMTIVELIGSNLPLADLAWQMFLRVGDADGKLAILGYIASVQDAKTGF